MADELKARRIMKERISVERMNTSIVGKMDDEVDSPPLPNE